MNDITTESASFPLGDRGIGFGSFSLLDCNGGGCFNATSHRTDRRNLYYNKLYKLIDTGALDKTTRRAFATPKDTFVRSIALNTFQGAAKVVQATSSLVFSALKTGTGYSIRRGQFKAEIRNMGVQILTIGKGAIQSGPVIGHYAARSIELVKEAAQEAVLNSDPPDFRKGW